MGNEVEAALNAFAITFNGRITPTGNSPNAKVGSTVVPNVRLMGSAGSLHR
jgi:hypothetical protein